MSIATGIGLFKLRFIFLAPTLELLRNVDRNPAKSVRTLADRLKRDYKRVHEDVETLTESRLLSREVRCVRRSCVRLCHVDSCRSARILAAGY